MGEVVGAFGGFDGVDDTTRCPTADRSGHGCDAADAPRLTGSEPPVETTPAPPLARDVNLEGRRAMRNYPEQPPVIPHPIEGYQLSLTANRCLSCHRLQYTEASGAPMISVTHYTDRDGQMLAERGAAPLLLHPVPRAADRRAAAGREHLRRHERPGRAPGERVAHARPGFLRRAWTLISRPSRHLSLGFLTLGGFVGGVVFWGGFNTALEATNTQTFCISCHEMYANVYQEAQRTIHFTNRSGVSASCPDCHVPQIVSRWVV